MSDDLKLYKVFEIYKDDLQKNYEQLYYALLGWKDSHLKQLYKDPNNLVDLVRRQDTDNFNIGDIVLVPIKNNGKYGTGLGEIKNIEIFLGIRCALVDVLGIGEILYDFDQLKEANRDDLIKE